MLTVRIRNGSNTFILTIQADATFGKLKGIIKEQDETIADGFKLSTGFPPKMLDAEDSLPIADSIGNNVSVRIHPAEEVTTSIVQGMSPPPRAKSATVASTSAKAYGSTGGSGWGGRVATLHDKGGKSQNKKASVAAPGRRSKKRSIFECGSDETDISTALISAVDGSGSGSGGGKSRFLRSVYRRAVDLQYSSTKAIARVESLHCNNFTFMPDNTPSSSSSCCSVGRVLASGAPAKMTVRYAKGSYATNRSNTRRSSSSSSSSGGEPSDAATNTTGADAAHMTNEEPWMRTNVALQQADSSYFHEDYVDCLPAATIRAVLHLALRSTATDGACADSDSGSSSDSESGSDSEGSPRLNMELLKPVNLAACSPRLFWSIVRLYGSNFARSYSALFPRGLHAPPAAVAVASASSSSSSCSSSSSSSSSAAMSPVMSAAAEAVDWGWLYERKLSLSEKALENLATERALKRHKKATAASKHQRKSKTNVAVEAAVKEETPEGQDYDKDGDQGDDKNES